MAIGDTNITVVGNIVADPELRFTPSGAAVANFRIASTPRSFNRQTNQWEDGEALFLTVNVWRQAAENVAESLSKGMRVIVTGRLKQRSYETREGEKRSVFEVEADEVGPSLTFAKADVQRTPRGGNSGGNYGGGNQGGGLGGNQGNQQGGFSNQNSGGFGGNQGNQQQSNQGGFGGNQNQSQGNNFNQGGFGGGSPQAAPDNDPWNSAPPAGSGGVGGADDEPPF
ncbi:single-stranded DNA-binding protein [Corynebacterium glutamicum]|uniref:single-stranded DNA-binding protein n=1 Tax=Corynebacterium TaxID=1716 RepID=UPI000723096C|nr:MULTISPECIES: single-stranded DNA-binding protein [Corynebacterium]ALP51377.1 single-stranded DNA-binding protein [Corynebacterium glutamicum]ANR63885.1 single-stranded DNA-binding protein [[Brevibacterium] flavum ZL-1]ANR66893.1 single-stranded DNA-binding protein [Corynebacterium glutamicum ZL-6]ANU34900.1 single-stranded DNA-binding protein [Corynebacterium glutamicum]APT08653.1 single-stranded DNA-binding protein [Corynebacterium glutamicum]